MNISKMSLSSGCGTDEKADEFRCFDDDHKCTAEGETEQTSPSDEQGRSVAVKRTLRQMSPSGTAFRGSSAKRMKLSVDPVESRKITKKPDLGMICLSILFG